MRRPSLTFIFVSLFIVYIAHSMWTIYGLFVPEPCPPTSRCLRPFLSRKPHLELQVYTSLRQKPTETHLKLAWKSANFSAHEAIEQEINVTIPSKTKKNGTLYTHVFLVRKGESPFHSNRASHSQSLLTTYIIKKAEAFNLMGDAPKKKPSSGQAVPITHWRTRLVVNVMTQDVTFSSHAVPADVHRFLQLSPEGDYLPILYIDELSYRIRDLQPVNESVTQMPLTISYSPISLGKLRLWVNMQESMRLLQNLGFTEKDMDEVKGIFSDTNLYFLMMTFLVAALHLLFDFLAFKNDISYWKKRETMVGLSSRVVVWRCVSTVIIFLYLMDEETSMLVLVPAGVGTIIEMWKVKKAFKIRVEWAGIKPTFIFGTKSDKEKETEEFDLQAMKYLSYLLYPLCAVGAVYSLIYNPHKSWYSWCIQSLVNGVYAFGFLFMLPQLFVNYKLKSVAHLPWRAFMYKAFNTFIDDIFAFIITMPTAHRLACFRDDIIFLIYLYQRWLYPVDKKRVNEFGQSFEEEANMKEEDKKTK